MSNVIVYVSLAFFTVSVIFWLLTHVFGESASAAFGLASVGIGMAALVVMNLAGDGSPYNLKQNPTLLVVGNTYQVVGGIAGTDIVGIKQIPDGSVYAFSTGDWKIPPCFVETSASEEEQFQPIECPK